ncbi:MAG: Cys-Gln thioester bond-forming surface protein, partial [Clostridiales bacterium]|nr:Cys-Gln thioester bond-forming surface protein [Clostridiales bacterium]
MALIITLGAVLPFYPPPVSAKAEEPEASGNGDVVVMVYSSGEIGPGTIAYNGKDIGKEGYIEFDGTKYPAFCVDPKLYAAELHPNGQYPVSISGTNLEPSVATVLHNSVPYVEKNVITDQFPGLTDLQIYAATKAAIRAVSSLSASGYSDDSLWTGDAQTVAFAKHLINLARTATEPMPEIAIYGYVDLTDPSLDGDFYVSTTTVQSSTYPLKSGTKIKLTLPEDAPAGAVITDASDNPIPADGVDNVTPIKIKVPKESVTESVSFEVQAELTIDSGVVLFGVPTEEADKADYQRYEIAMPYQPASYVIPFAAEPQADEPTPTPGESTPPPSEETPPPDEQTPPPETPAEPGKLEIVKLEAGTTKGLAGAEFKVTNATGGVIGHYSTDSSGKVSIDEVEPGAYYVDEVTPPEGYALDANTHKDVVVISEQTAIVTFENEPLASLVITKIDGNTGEALSGASFRVALDDGSDFYDVQTDGSGEAKLENLKAGTYTVTELTPPDGYVLNTTVDIVKLEPGKEGTLTFSDWTKPGIIIKKYDEKTGQPLADAEFSVAHKGGNIVFEGMTDGSGLITVEGLDPGWYTVTEMAAPDGYLIVSPVKDVLLDEGKTVEVKFDNRPRPSLVIQKLDAQTGQPLAGAEFNVIKTEDKTVSEYVTDASGTITINDLDEAIYSVVEVKAPEGYILDPQHYDIALEWGMTKTLIYENILRPKLEIKKVDSVTGEPLGGARFLVTKTEDLTVSEYVTDESGVLLLENLDPAIYTVEEILAPEGWILDPQKTEIELEGGKTKTLIYEDVRKPTLIITKTNSLTFEPIQNATFSIEYESASGGIFPLGRFRTDENGQIILPKVAPGWYIVTEVIPAPGFSLPDNPVTRLYLNPGENAYEAYTDGFYLKSGVSDRLLAVAAGGDFLLGAEVIDYPLNSIVIKKVSSVNGELLAGAAFEVRRVNEEMSGGSGTLIGRYTTDNSGVIVITDLEPGGYIVEEVQAPPNYMLIENSKQQVWMKYDGTSIEELTFSNIPYGNLLVTKSDALTGKPLQGARFRVTEGTGAVAGNTNGEYTTDSAGQFLVSNLKPGAYVVTELEAPHGYVADTVPQTLTIGVDGKTYQVNFANQPIGGLLITKRDSISMLPLAGATFQVTDSHGAFVGDAGNGLYTTDATGTIIITDIEPGAYVITEVDAPNGYLKDDNSQTVHIEYGMVKYVDFYNTPLGGLVVKKYDSVTQEPLAEAVFMVTDILGAVVGTSDGLFRTDETGTFYIPSLPPGGYRVQEIQAPEGYILDNVAQTVHILDEKMYSLEFFNRPVNEFVIMKYDAITKEPLPNATVKVEKLGDTTVLVGEYITDADGRINVPDLEPGSYSVQEIQAPPGYALDNTAKIVNLVQNKGLVVTLFDYPLGGLLIRKYDSQSMQALPGAVFA